MWKVLTFQNDFFCIWPNLVLAKRSKTARPNFDWRNLVTPPVDGLEPTPQLLSWRLRPWKFHVLKEKEHRRHAPQIDLRVRPQFVLRCAAVFVSVEQEELDFQIELQEFPGPLRVARETVVSAVNGALLCSLLWNSKS